MIKRNWQVVPYSRATGEVIESCMNHWPCQPMWSRRQAIRTSNWFQGVYFRSHVIDLRTGKPLSGSDEE